MRPRACFLFVVLCFFADGLVAEENRIWLDGKINGKAVRLILDTGSYDSILYPDAARDLGIKIFPPVFGVAGKGFNVRLGTTEPFELTTFNLGGQTTFGTYDFEKAGVRTRGHGLYGWKHLKTNTFLIDGAALTVVDAGSYGGVSVRPQQWRDWKTAHTNAPLTLDLSHMPSGGFTITEEAFARELSIGNLRLTDVPIHQPTPREIATAEVAFGLAAIARLDLIVDGGQGWAHLRPRSTPPAPYDHNRLGAVFLPRHSLSEEVVARVVERGPAHGAGIRNGDVLFKIDELLVTKGRAQGMALCEFWERPAGTKLDLTIKRGDETLKIPVVLRDILVP
jgi:hypothetical protein